MDAGLFAQFVMNGLMLGMMYALVAVGFTLFFGVLDVIKFSHGDVLTVGAFTALAAFAGLSALGLHSPWLDLVVMLVLATAAMALSGEGGFAGASTAAAPSSCSSSPPTSARTTYALSSAAPPSARSAT